MMEPFLLLLFGATAASTLPYVRFFKIHHHLRFIGIQSRIEVGMSIASTRTGKIAFAFTAWLLGPARRGYLRGTGRQACWAYLGYTIRGDWDDVGQLWISLTDCHHASGLDLLTRLDRVHNTEKRNDGVKGWLLTQVGMTQLFDSLRGDPFPIHKLRLFLEREVWRTRRG